MTTTSRVMITRRSRRDLAQALAAREEAAHHMYDAELALHVAHQARVGEWVNAAYERLHEAIAEHTAASADVERAGGLTELPGR